MGAGVARPHDGAHRQPAFRGLQPERKLASLTQTLDSNHLHNRVGNARAGSAGWPANPLFSVAPWWGRQPARASIPYLVEWVVALVALALLMVFVLVVRESVARGENLRVAMSVHSAATQHCNSLAALGSGEACLRLLNAPAKAATQAAVAQTTSMASIAAH